MTTELKSMFGENIPETTINYSEQQAVRELEKKKKDFLKKQTGMKRELIKLIGGVSSLVDKKDTKNNQKNSNWVWAPFSNPARTDKLKLVHWQRAEDVNKDYDFSKFNQKIEIIEFTKDEYDLLIKPNDRNWNYEQTKYLWELLKNFELRFTVVYDRFDENIYGKRTVESLKDRYYSVSRVILESRKMFDHPILKSGYNSEQELKKRNYLERTMNKTFEDLKKEEDLLMQNKNNNNELKLPLFSDNNNNGNYIKIPMNEENYNEILDKKNNDFEEYIKNNITQNDSFVYLRSQKLKHSLPVNEKIKEQLDEMLKNFDVQLVPTSKVESAYDNYRNNLVIYITLKKYLDKKNKELNHLQPKFNQNQKIVNNSAIISDQKTSRKIIIENFDNDNDLSENNNKHKNIITIDQSEINEKNSKKNTPLKDRKKSKTPKIKKRKNSNEEENINNTEKNNKKENKTPLKKKKHNK